MNLLNFSVFIDLYSREIHLGTLSFVGLICLIYLGLHLCLIRVVTPRVDRLNGFQSTKRFAINRRQTGLYQSCFTEPTKRLKGYFKASRADRLMYRMDKWLGKISLGMILLGVTFLFLVHWLNYRF
jgi:hypothetical protein